MEARRRWRSRLKWCVSVRVTLPADALIEIAEDTVEGRIEDDDTERAHKRSLGVVLVGVDAGDGPGGRDRRPVRAATDRAQGARALRLDHTPTERLGPTGHLRSHAGAGPGRLNGCGLGN